MRCVGVQPIKVSKRCKHSHKQAEVTQWLRSRSHGAVVIGLDRQYCGSARNAIKGKNGGCLNSRLITAPFEYDFQSLFQAYGIWCQFVVLQNGTGIGSCSAQQSHMSFSFPPMGKWNSLDQGIEPSECIIFHLVFIQLTRSTEVFLASTQYHWAFKFHTPMIIFLFFSQLATSQYLVAACLPLCKTPNK